MRIVHRHRLLGLTGRFASGSVRFVTMGMTIKIAVASAAGAAALAVVAGAAVGRHISDHGRALADLAAQEFTLREIGKLDASLAQLEPRVSRLAAQVSELRNFQARLGASQAMPLGPSIPVNRAPDVTAGDAALLVGCCIEAGARPSRDSQAATQWRVDSIDAALSALEEEAETHSVALASLPGRKPVEGARLTSPFGNRKDPFLRGVSFHPGIDLAAPPNTPILASAGGRVRFAGRKPGYGKVVEIDHRDGLSTRYAHASRLFVKTGDLVSPSQHVANVGSTGRSTAPHLHFEVLREGVAQNPADFLALFEEDLRG